MCHAAPGCIATIHASATVSQIIPAAVAGISVYVVNQFQLRADQLMEISGATLSAAFSSLGVAMPVVIP